MPPKKMIPVNGDVDVRKVLAMGASTGGTEALRSVMLLLPARIPPTVIVQHIPPVFSKAFAERLNQLCPFEVKEAEDGDELRPSRVLIAPGGKQMKIQQTAKGLSVRVTDDAPMNLHKPSIDYLFHSVASVAGKNSIGVILTGMGGDGAQGLLEMRKKGAKTLAQDEQSSVVYGMPKVAFEMGAVEKVVSLDEVATEILNILSMKKAA
jgi:two-component system chemotaxis response regulator CheB